MDHAPARRAFSIPPAEPETYHTDFPRIARIGKYSLRWSQGFKPVEAV
jgi:hypothetical protein